MHVDDVSGPHPKPVNLVKQRVVQSGGICIRVQFPQNIIGESCCATNRGCRSGGAAQVSTLQRRGSAGFMTISDGPRVVTRATRAMRTSRLYPCTALEALRHGRATSMS